MVGRLESARFQAVADDGLRAAMALASVSQPELSTGFIGGSHERRIFLKHARCFGAVADFFVGTRTTKDRDSSSPPIVAEEGFNLPERRDRLIGAIQIDEGRGAIEVRPWILGVQNRGLVREVDRARVVPFHQRCGSVSRHARFPFVKLLRAAGPDREEDPCQNAPVECRTHVELTKQVVTHRVRGGSPTDECKDWADKAAALASYAKQAEDETLFKNAMMIKGRAVRRMGELLKDIEPKPGARTDRVLVTVGPRNRLVAEPRDATDPRLKTRQSVADAAGRQTKEALRIASIPKREFEKAIEAEKPPTLIVLFIAMPVANLKSSAVGPIDRDLIRFPLANASTVADPSHYGPHKHSTSTGAPT